MAAILERDLLEGQELRREASEAIGISVEQFVDRVSDLIATRFGWVRSLPKPVLLEFVRELFALVLREDSAGEPTMEEVGAFVQDWRATAQAYEDPEAVAELLEPADEEQIILE